MVPYHCFVADALDFNGRGSGAPRRQIGVERRRQQISEGGNGGAGRLHIAEHSRVAIVPAHRHNHLAEDIKQLLEVNAFIRQAAVELLADERRRRIGINSPVAERIEIIGHRFDGGAAPATNLFG